MTNQSKIPRPYGLWLSPISAALVGQRVRLSDVQWSGDGALVWSEARSGKTTLMAAHAGGFSPRQELTGEQNPRGGVGYGGGAFTVSRAPGHDLVIFANRDNRLYRREGTSAQPKPVTPAIGSGAVAAPAISADGQWIIYVYSDGKTDLLALVDAQGAEWPVQLARGADFYMQPVWHPSGAQAAWIEWDHPNMPWDGTRVMLADLQGTPPRIAQARVVGGGQDTPAQQPAFSPDGRYLSFIEESGEWPDLVLLDLQTGQRSVLVRGEGFDLATPAWVQGQRTVGWAGDSQSIYYLCSEAGASSLWTIRLAGGPPVRIDTAPFSSLGQLSVHPTRAALAFLASAPDQPDQVVVWDGQLETAAYTTPATIDPAYLPTLQNISWESPEGFPVHGLYYPPANPRYSDTGLPPAIVHIHGGPTSLAEHEFNPQAAYFTSRGYAYVELNYRGSTGYGRAYRNALRESWGEKDTQDAADCARALAAQGLANAKRLVIMGGSAGGYTVLNTLIHHPGLYKAGVCSYGVTNLFALNQDTHKFEAHYNDQLVGLLPEAAARFHAWSPVFHAGQIQDALYLFQGSDDAVVPPSQAEEIAAALRAKGIPFKYKVYEGEGHGFRKSENIADFYQETERFLQTYVLFAP